MRGRVDRAMGGGDSGGGEGSVVDKTKGEGEEAVEGGKSRVDKVMANRKKQWLMRGKGTPR